MQHELQDIKGDFNANKPIIRSEPAIVKAPPIFLEELEQTRIPVIREPVKAKQTVLNDKVMVVDGFNMDNPMELVGIRKHNIDPMAGDDDYYSKFVALYPFAAVDFEVPETHIGDATNGEFVVPEDKSKHEYAVPTECTDCLELEAKIMMLEADLEFERRQNLNPVLNDISSLSDTLAD